MFDCLVKIEPKSSSCVAQIEWDSELRLMHIVYTGNDQSYEYTDINWNDILDLESKALVQQSWGKALGLWKKEREIKFAIQAKEKFERVWKGLHETDKQLFAQLSKEALKRDRMNKAIKVNKAIKARRN
jgi:hypothetical protein